MKTKARFSRREFVQGIGYVSAVGAWNAFAAKGMVAKSFVPAGTSTAVRFAYIGSTPDSSNRKEHGIYVFAVKENRWEEIQRISSPAPSFLILHPNQQVLYVANEIDEHEGFPCGTLESYSIDPHSGMLRLLQQQRLSLSGTRPRQLAISPDGRHMAVTLYGGGAYNLLALDEKGLLGRVTGIVKELGSGRDRLYQASAHPNDLIFDPENHHLLSTDLGCDRLHVFRVIEGKLQRNQQVAATPGSGPGQLALHPSGKFLYLANELDGSLSGYRYISAAGEIAEQLLHISNGIRAEKITAPLESSLALDPSGRFLYSSFTATRSDLSSGIKVWNVDPSSGKLSHLRTLGQGLISPRTLMVTVTGDGLYALDSSKSSILYIAVNPVNGEPDDFTHLAYVDAPSSFALKYR